MYQFYAFLQTILISSTLFSSGLDHTVIRSRVAAIQRVENLQQISAFMDSGIRFWSHEWQKHGTCAESEIDQREYFETALKLKQKVNLLQNLKDPGIEPDDEFYSLDSIKEAIKQGSRFTPGIECTKDSGHNSQLYQVYMCVDTSGSNFIECPIFPKSKCGSQIQFPKF